MSGICGFLDTQNKMNKAKKTYILNQMTEQLKHRGPDYGYHYFDNFICMGFKGLRTKNFNSYESIYNEDRSITGMLDGSIYNSDELTKSLLKKGHLLITNTHSELIVHLYEEYNEEFIKEIDGDFALSIWDCKNRKLILGRDPLGTKPLFYYFGGGLFSFGSEIKSILSNSFIRKEVNVPGINDFLSLGYIPHPETIFKNIYHVNPGSLLILENQQIKEKSYWTFEFKDTREHNEDYYVLTLRDLLSKAVKKRMRADVPVGAFLSGGMDSSGICAYLNDLTDKPVKAFSIGFSEDNYNEIPYAKIVAEHLHLDWDYKYVSHGEILPLFEKIIYYLDAPFEDTSNFPSYYGAKTASEQIKVVLTGDGPDQLMAGSYHHSVLQNRLLNDSIFQKALRNCGIKYLFKMLPLSAPTDSFSNKVKRRLLREALSFRERIYEGWIIPRLLKKYLYTDDFFKISKNFHHARNILPVLNRVKERHPLEQSIYYDIHFYLHDDLLTKVDRTTTANSIEYRTPYLDKEILTFLETIPLKYRINGMETKYLLKKTFEGIIPDQIIYKKKQGFAIPRDEWFKNNYSQYIRKIVLSRKSLERGYFKRKALEDLVNRFFAGKTSYFTGSSALLTCLVSLEIWHRMYMD